MEVDITGIDNAIPIELFGQKLFIFQGVIVIMVALMVLLVLAIVLRVAVQRQNVADKPSPVLVIAETLWKFSGGPVEEIPVNVRGALHVFAGNLFMLMVLINTSGIWGIHPAAGNIFIAAAFGLMVGVMIHGIGIATNFKEYVTGYFKPFWIFAVINIMDIFSQIISISMRLFGNMLAGIILAELLRMGLNSIHLDIAYPIFGGLLSLYDLFIGVLQSLVFMTLSMTYIKGKLVPE